ncbi:MAG TPA: SDR family oxidoreductase [Chloroflexi bacterium]|nr:SDR family oxidoreductase [Chloroflexota bacterium]
MAEQATLAQLISLAGRRALITGAAAGLGKAMARRFAEAGADLELVDIAHDRLEAIVADLPDFGVEVHTHRVDLSRKEEIDRLWQTWDDAHLPDILVNNAGIYPFEHFLDVNEDAYQRVLGINLSSVYWMCQHMISRRKRRKLGGVIINIGSIEAMLPFKMDLVHYSMSKAGVIALTRSLAKEYARHGFRINVLIPGGILTAGTRAAARQLLRFKFGLIKEAWDFRQRLPAGRIGQPDEVARMAVVLASDLASYVHGASIPVDGGFLAS